LCAARVSQLTPQSLHITLLRIAAEQFCAGKVAQLCADAARARTMPCSLQMLMRRPWGGRFCGAAAENVTAAAKKKKKRAGWGERVGPRVGKEERLPTDHA